MSALDTKEFWEEKTEDLERALAAMLRHYGLTYGQFEQWHVYLADGWSADVIEVDENGHRVLRSPVWVDAFESKIKDLPLRDNPPAAPDTDG